MMMKNSIKYVAMMIIATFGIAGFSSCDDDVDEAMVLSGEWEGRFGMYYYNNDGFKITADNSVLKFDPDYAYATHGTGGEFDYYSRGDIAFEYFFFNWKIEDGKITLSYPHNHELDVVIYDYHIDNNYFYGYFETGTRFSLDKTYDYYDWTPYVNLDYYYCTDREWRSSRSKNDVIEVQGNEQKNYVHGRDLTLSAPEE